MISIIPNRDSDGNVLYRNVIAGNEEFYHPRVFDYTTGKNGSLCNKSSDLSDLGDGELLFFDSSYQPIVKGDEESDEAFQARLDSNAKFTWLYFTPTKKYAIKGCKILYRGTPSDEFDAWFEIAPHIPKALGGSIPSIDGGVPLEMFNEGELISIDGGATAQVDLDPVYLSHRLGVKIEHEIGDKIKIMVIFDIYF